MVTAPTLEALGFSREEIADRIVKQAADQLLQEYEQDEDGEEYPVSSALARKLKTVVQQRIDKLIVDLADKHIAPRVDEFIEQLTLQKTNEWGEARGSKVTFIEYLVQRAESYMTEQVNYEGKPKGADGYSWSARSTRIAFMVDNHLHYQIDTAMKKAFSDVNTALAKGLHEAVRLSINEVTSKLRVEAKVG